MHAASTAYGAEPVDSPGEFVIAECHNKCVLSHHLGGTSTAFFFQLRAQLVLTLLDMSHVYPPCQRSAPSEPRRVMQSKPCRLATLNFFGRPIRLLVPINNRDKGRFCAVLAQKSLPNTNPPRLPGKLYIVDGAAGQGRPPWPMEEPGCQSAAANKGQGIPRMTIKAGRSGN